MTKYKAAAEICNNAITEIAKAVQPGARIVDLISKGNQFVEEYFTSPLLHQLICLSDGFRGFLKARTLKRELHFQFVFHLTMLLAIVVLWSLI